MNISVCITVLNEEDSIGSLLNSLLNQSKKANEIVIVDGGSRDKTIEIINHYQKRFGRKGGHSVIKLLKEKCNRARGRNLSIEVAENEVIAITDAGCTTLPDWLENLTKPFRNEGVGISAGFYRMVGINPLQKAMARFLGTSPQKFDINFLPSTRSLALRKRVWEEVGGFPEETKNSAEDTHFNYSALKLGVKYARVKSAVVEWGMPNTLGDFFQKIKSYAEWDARTKIFVFPKKGLASHNIKALFILLRYLVGVALLIFCAIHTPLLVYWFIGLLVYFFWAFRKVYLEFGDWRVALWGPVLQVISDFGVILGFVSGLLKG